MIYNEEFETLPREALEALQLKRLKQVVQRVYHTVAFYQRAFDKAGVKPDDIKSLEDLKRLPFTTKQDLRDNYPYGLFAVPMESVVRIHASSGTTGKPTVVGYTEARHRDLVRADGPVLSWRPGTTKDDIIHNAYGYGLFTGGLGVHYGAEKLGAAVIPISGGNTKRQIMIMQDFGPTVICCTPSYALHLAETGRGEGRRLRRTSSFGWASSAPSPGPRRCARRSRASCNITAIDIYGLSEIIGPACRHRMPRGRNGAAHLRGSFHPRDHQPRDRRGPAGRREGRTGIHHDHQGGLPRDPLPDAGHLPSHPGALHAAAGPTSAWSAITGRTDDMLIIRGVNVFPSQIESVLMEVEGGRAALPAHRGPRGEPGHAGGPGRGEREALPTDEVKDLQKLERRISKDIKEYLGVSAKVKLVEPKTIQRSEGKAKRVIDKRKI